ncbi:hypothetical protein QYE80_21515 [Pseudomonas tohonis]|jgi:hypothetical protein|nr:hypothetical protein L682_30065 [Pseudomonas alcaligenes OT 69]MDN4147587.1 hypothetical protein [Pseudomonas tohonis]
MPIESQVLDASYRGYDYSLTIARHQNGFTVEVDIHVDRYPTRPEGGLHPDYEAAKKKGSELAQRLIDQLINS